MEDTTTLQEELERIKERNTRVEAEKAWETSLSRKITIIILTYCLISIFFIIVHIPRPFLNALVPTMGYVISTVSIPLVKKIWIKYLYKK